LAKKLQAEIKQARPFSSPGEEAILNVHRTADCFRRHLQQTLKPYGITTTQYNALRILRGAGVEGLTCSELGKRLVSSDPDITRLLARLQKQALIERLRHHHDRRVVMTIITSAGLALLERISPVLEQRIDQSVRHMAAAQLEVLIDLLEILRAPLADDTSRE
jgi:DNA-binding MarR family transcriptional regulator